MSHAPDRPRTDRADTLGGWLRAAYEGAPECPSAEIWAQLASGELTGESRQRILDHAERCAACAAERDLALLFAEERPRAVGASSAGVEAEIVASLESAFPFHQATGQDAGISTGARRRPAMLAVSRWLAAAAVLLLAAGSWQYVRRERDRLPDPQRDDAVRGAALELLAPTGDLDGAPAAFDWAPIDGAASYTVAVRRVYDELVWSGRTDRPPLAAAALPELPRGVVFTWSVIATDASGGELARSELASFRIRPETAPEPASSPQP